MTYKLKEHVTDEMLIKHLYKVALEIENEEEENILIDLCNQIGVDTKHVKEIHEFCKVNVFGDPKLYSVRDKYNTPNKEYALRTAYVNKKNETYKNREIFNIQDLIELGYVEVEAELKVLKDTKEE